MLCILIIALVPLVCIVRPPSLILDVVFTPIALRTRIIASIKPFRKEVRRRGRRRGRVMPALEVTHFRIVPVGMPPILASARGPPVALLFLLGVMPTSSVFFEFLLNR